MSNHDYIRGQMMSSIASSAATASKCSTLPMICITASITPNTGIEFKSSSVRGTKRKRESPSDSIWQLSPLSSFQLALQDRPTPSHWTSLHTRVADGNFRTLSYPELHNFFSCTRPSVHQQKYHQEPHCCRPLCTWYRLCLWTLLPFCHIGDQARRIYHVHC